ncbi:uncharacterized protein LOC110446724, partial [Mizuhopecten yessoensis]|uniref:uncharacterized protein LOC110446724 n=1 Tax=Mizuhopecten yessoensis TaxID=6573 RepID=UPI000B45DB65
MNIKIFLIFVVMMCAMHQGPAVYRDLTCVEPEPGYAKRLFYYFNAGEIEKVCPKAADLTLRIGNEIVCNLLCVLLTLLLGYAPSIGKVVKEKWSAAVSMFQEWRA